MRPTYDRRADGRKGIKTVCESLLSERLMFEREKRKGEEVEEKVRMDSCLQLSKPASQPEPSSPRKRKTVRIGC